MIKYELTEEIKAPVDKVFAYSTDFRNNAKWQDGVVESTPTPEGPTQLGTKFKTVRTFLGQHLEATGEVTEFIPNKKFAFKATSGTGQFNLAQTFESIPSGTKTTIRMELEPGGVFKLAEGALAGNLKKTFESQTAKLKELMEA